MSYILFPSRLTHRCRAGRDNKRIIIMARGPTSLPGARRQLGGGRRVRCGEPVTWAYPDGPLPVFFFEYVKNMSSSLFFPLSSSSLS